jgi:hypothetical protein
VISGYLPFLIHLVLLVAFFGGIGAVDGWLRGLAQAAPNLNRATLFGFLVGCTKGIGFLVMFTLIALYLPILTHTTW